MPDPSRFIFRNGTHQDLPQMVRLAVRSWSQYQHLLTPDNWNNLNAILTSTQTFEEFLNKSACILCENQGTVVGMAFLVPNGNPTDIYEKEWCHLRFVSVDPDSRGRGIGKALTKAAIQLAVEQGEHTMALHTSEMMGPAIRIYEQLGFRMLRELPEKLGVRYWLYTLSLELPSHS